MGRHVASTESCGSALLDTPWVQSWRRHSPARHIWCKPNRPDVVAAGFRNALYNAAKRRVAKLQMEMRKEKKLSEDDVGVFPPSGFDFIKVS